jgi:hypothetical protein
VSTGLHRTAPLPRRTARQFDSGFAAPDRERIEIVGGEATLVLQSPFLPEPDGPAPSLAMWRGRVSNRIEVQSIDQYRAEVDDLTAAILDGTPRASTSPSVAARSRPSWI